MGHFEGEKTRGITRTLSRYAAFGAAFIGFSFILSSPVSSSHKIDQPKSEDIEGNPMLLEAQNQLAEEGFVDMIVEYEGVPSAQDNGLTLFLASFPIDDDDQPKIELKSSLKTRPVALVRVNEGQALSDVFRRGKNAFLNVNIPVPVTQNNDVDGLTSEGVDPADATGASWVHREFGLTGEGARIFVPDTGITQGNVSADQACFSQNGVDQHGNQTSFSACPGGGESEIGPGAGKACEFPGCDHGPNVGTVDSRMAPGATLFPIQIGSRDVNGNAFISYFSFLEALDYINSRSDLSQRDLLQTSFAYFGFSLPCNPYEPVVAELIRELIDKGVLMVDATANGNDPRASLDGIVPATACLQYGEPAADGKISVGSVDPTGTKITEFTQLGLTITALGFDPITIGQFSGSGNSLSSPQVAGAAALLTGMDPRLTPIEKERLLAGAGKPVQRGKYTARVLDVGGAVRNHAQNIGYPGRPKPPKSRIYAPYLRR